MGFFDKLKTLFGSDTIKASRELPQQKKASSTFHAGAGGAGDAALDDEVRALLGKDQKIAAIKRVREATGLGLAESKDYVEAIERGEAPLSTGALSSSSSSSSSWQEEAKAALKSGNKILAVKIVRDATGLSLKDAKDAVDALEVGGALPSTATRSSSAAAAATTNDEVQRTLVALVRAGKTIEAIKLYRTATGTSLKDAKDAIDVIAGEIADGRH
jgi:ribosomal protein L7/L12